MEWIQQGSRGDEVLAVQKKLQAKGFDPGPVDGIFGSKTTAAVRRFQEKHGLQVDGIVGPETGGALGIIETEADTPASKPDSPAVEVRSEVISPKKPAAEEKQERIDAKAAAERESKQDAVEAVTGAMKSAGDEAEEESKDKIGGSLWSRITGRSRKRNR